MFLSRARFLVLLLALLVPFALLVGCSDSDDDDDDDNTSPKAIGAFIVTTDYQTGSFTTVTLDEPRTVSEDIGTICADAIARTAGNRVYIVGRSGCDYIRVLDTKNNYSLLEEYSVGSNTNPQDICIIDEQKAYVSRLASSEILVLNPQTGQQLGVIDLSSLDDGDGSPEPALMIYIEELHYVFVAIQRLNEWVNIAPSYVTVIDSRSDTIVKNIALEGLNPFTDFVYRSDEKQLFIGCNGSYGLFDGGIEFIDVISLKTQGYALHESTIEGDLLKFEIISSDRGYVLFSDIDFNTAIRAFNPSQADAGSLILETEGYSLNNIAVNDRGELWVVDRTYTAPALHVFKATDGQLLEKLLLQGLPPFWITFIQE